MAFDVFISYSSKDAADADATCTALEAAGIRCWIAPRDVLPSIEYGAGIVKAIEASRVMVLLFSSNANASSQVRREVACAADNHIPILPVRIEDIKPTEAMQYFLSNIHWLDAITPPFAAHLKTLTDQVRALLKVGPGDGGPIPQTRGEPIEPPVAALGKSIFIDRSFTMKLFLVLSGKQTSDATTIARLMAQLAEIYETILYDSGGTSIFADSIRAEDIVKNKLTAIPFPVNERALAVSTKIKAALGADLLADAAFIQKAQHYNLLKGIVPRAAEDNLSYLLEIFVKAALLGSDLLVDPAREPLMEAMLQRLTANRFPSSDFAGLKVQTYRHFSDQISDLINPSRRLARMTTVTAAGSA